MRPLFGPLMAAFNRRRLAHLGVDENAQQRVLSLISAELARHGPLTRTELSDRIQSAGIAMDTSRRVHVFPLAVATGVACIGPGEGGGARLVARSDWLRGNPEDLERDRALAELARRYFAAFAPATETDFAGWAGLPLRDVRAGIAAIASELREVEVRGLRAWQPRRRAPRAVPAELVRLLPAFDNHLMGHRDRDFITPPSRWAEIGPGGGILRPAITVGGAAAGTWRLARQRGALACELRPFGGLDRPIGEAIEAEIEDIGRFEGAAVKRT